jgi:hypothetical protein
VNSLYPYVMRKMSLPYGLPVWSEGMPEPTIQRPLFIATVELTAKLKPGRIPCIQVKSHPSFMSTEYVKEISEPTMLTVTSVDLELWSEQYDLDILTWDGAYMFYATHGLFDKYIDKWMGVKEKTVGGMRLIAKLHLNSLYGKFATNPDVTGKIPTFCTETDTVRLVKGTPATRDPVYTAMGAFITAYARAYTIRAAQANYARFLYADTDSLHLSGLGEPVGITVDKSELGAWKHEYDFVEGIFLKAKQYGELKMHQYARGKESPYGPLPSSDHYEIHVAGLPRDIAGSATLDDLRPGREFGGKLTPKRVPGGIVLTETTFTL